MENSIKDPKPGIGQFVWRGIKGKCPRCGKSHLFQGFLKLVPECKSCGFALGNIRADDFPPYITIVVVGHIVVPGLLFAEKAWQPSIAMQLAVWLPITALMSFLVLPRAKGIVVGLMLHLGLRGDETQ